MSRQSGDFSPQNVATFLQLLPPFYEVHALKPPHPKSEGSCILHHSFSPLEMLTCTTRGPPPLNEKKA